SRTDSDTVPRPCPKNVPGDIPGKKPEWKISWPRHNLHAANGSAYFQFLFGIIVDGEFLPIDEQLFSFGLEGEKMLVQLQNPLIVFHQKFPAPLKCQDHGAGKGKHRVGLMIL